MFEKLKKGLSSKHPKIKWDEHSLVFYDEENHVVTIKENIFYAWTGFSIDLSKVKWLTTDGNKVVFQDVDGNSLSEDFGPLNYYVNDAIQYYLIEKCRMTLNNIGRNIDGTLEQEDVYEQARYAKYRSIFYGGISRVITKYTLSKNLGMKKFMTYELFRRYIYTEASRRIIPAGGLENHNNTLRALCGYEATLFKSIAESIKTRNELSSMSWESYYEDEMPKNLNFSSDKETEITDEIVTKLGNFTYDEDHKIYKLESNKRLMYIHVSEDSFGQSLRRFRAIEQAIDELEIEYRNYAAEQICKKVKDWKHESTLEKEPTVEELAEMFTEPEWNFYTNGSYTIRYYADDIFFLRDVWVNVRDDDKVSYILR